MFKANYMLVKITYCLGWHINATWGVNISEAKVHDRYGLK